MSIHALFVIAPEDFRDEEFLEPKAALERTGHTVSVASTRTGEAKGMLGATFNVLKNVEDLNGDDFDMLVFVGGGGIDSLKMYDEIHLIRLARQAHLAKRIVGAICLATKILANAEILQGKKVTGWESARGYVEERGGKWHSDVDVVVDDHIVTATGPTAAKRFGEILASRVENL